MSATREWGRLQRRRVSRRTLLGASARAGVGVAGLALVGCGGRDEIAPAAASTPAAPPAQPQEQAQASQPAPQPQARPTPQQPQPQPAQPAAAAATGEPKTGGTIRAFWPVEDSHLDPHTTREHFSAALWRTVGNGILKQAAVTFEPQADLAINWENPDPLTFTFNLHPNVTWHDQAPLNGRAFKASDAVYSFERMADTTEAGAYPRASSFASVEEFAAPDDHTFQITTTQPYAPMFVAVSDKWSIVVPPELIERFGDLRSGDALIGTGPFISQGLSNTRGGRVVRNPKYFIPDRPYLDAIEWSVITDTAAQEAAFQAQQMDIFGQFGVVDAEALDRLGTLPFAEVLPYVVNSFGLSLIGGPNNKAPLNDLRVRQAINLTVDREDLGRAAFPSAPLHAAGYLASPTWGIQTDEMLTKPGWGNKAMERAEARALLDAAGFGGGLTIVANTTDAYPAYHITRALVLQSQLAEVGITLDLNVLEFGAMKEKETARDFDFTVASYSFPNDPDFPLYNAFHDQGSRNYWENHQAEYDRIVEAQRAELDPRARRELVREAQWWLLANAPAATDDWFRTQHWVVNRRLRGFASGSTTYHWEMAEWWIDGTA